MVKFCVCCGKQFDGDGAFCSDCLGTLKADDDIQQEDEVKLDTPDLVAIWFLRGLSVISFIIFGIIIPATGTFIFSFLFAIPIFIFVYSCVIKNRRLSEKQTKRAEVKRIAEEEKRKEKERIEQLQRIKREENRRRNERIEQRQKVEEIEEKIKALRSSAAQMIVKGEAICPVCNCTISANRIICSQCRQTLRKFVYKTRQIGEHIVFCSNCNRYYIDLVDCPICGNEKIKPSDLTDDLTDIMIENKLKECINNIVNSLNELSAILKDNYHTYNSLIVQQVQSAVMKIEKDQNQLKEEYLKCLTLYRNRLTKSIEVYQSLLEHENEIREYKSIADDMRRRMNEYEENSDSTDE